MGTPVLTGVKAAKRGKELQQVRERAYQHLNINPLLTPGELKNILLSEGFDISVSTIRGWVGRWEMKDRRSKEDREKPNTIAVSWEQVVASVPNIETLGVLLLEGFIAKLEDENTRIKILEKENEQLKEEQKKLLSEFNERLAKAKIGTLTLNTFQHKFLPKE